LPARVIQANPPFIFVSSSSVHPNYRVCVCVVRVCRCVIFFLLFVMQYRVASLVRAYLQDGRRVENRLAQSLVEWQQHHAPASAIMMQASKQGDGPWPTWWLQPHLGYHELKKGSCGAGGKHYARLEKFALYRRQVTNTFWHNETKCVAVRREPHPPVPPS
jgi:hypothetical protein